ncbi:MAG: dipeptidase [Bryobacteraceae bacterium]
MKRRDLLRRGVLSSVSMLAAPMINRNRFQLFARSPKEYSARTIELVGSSLVIDMLGLITLDWAKLAGWHEAPSTFTRADFQKLKASGIDVFHPAVDLAGKKPYEATIKWIRSWNALLVAHNNYFVAVSNADDLSRARREGKIGIVLGMQNSDHFLKISDVRFFHRLGQRLSQLTYNARNLIGNGCTERHDTGLTEYGASVVGEMNSVGMAIDVSHAGERTTLDAFAASTKPVLVTHSNCRALSGHPRCKSDVVIKSLGSHGSVMGITGIRTFVYDREPVTIQHVLDHYDHVARLVGVEHLGLGSDTDLEGRDQRFAKGRTRFDIGGLDHPKRVYDLTEGLVQRKYSNRSIEMILGLNFERVLSEIWPA